jgi:hypothetical protein
VIYISHRGNLEGPNKESENTPEAIDAAIDLGFSVEVDVWLKDSNLYLGHDEPVLPTTLNWLLERKQKLFLHCKNIDALVFFQSTENKFHYFWHENDTVTLTSFGMIWAYPGKQPIKESIAVMPELYNDDTSECIGICTDYPLKYRA